MLNDPAKGTYSVPMQTFDDSFTGICLFFEPAEALLSRGQAAVHAAVRRKKRLVGAGTAIAFVTLTTVIFVAARHCDAGVFPLYFSRRLLTGENPEWLMSFTLAARASACFSSLSRGSRRSIPRINGKLTQWWEIPPFCGKSCTCRWRFLTAYGGRYSGPTERKRDDRGAACRHARTAARTPP